MSDYKVKISLENLGKALGRLEEALQADGSDSMIRDATIQRFEFCIELYWKTFKRLLEQEGILVTTPREALQQAYRVRWIHNEAAWLQMLKDRNQTSHVYDEATALMIYNHIRSHFSELARTYEFLKDKFLDNLV